jgi:hypothetical protein
MEMDIGNAMPQEKNTFDESDEEIIIQDSDQEKLVGLFKMLNGRDDAIALETEKKMLDNIELKIQEQRKKMDIMAMEITPLRRKINELEVKKYNEHQILKSLMRQTVQVHRNAKRTCQIFFMQEQLIQRRLAAKNRKSLMDIKNAFIDGECDFIKKNGNKCHRISNYGISKKAKMNICKYVFFLPLYYYIQ